MAITLLDMLMQAGMLTPRQIDDALQHRVFYGGKIGTLQCDELEVLAHVAAAIAQQHSPAHSQAVRGIDERRLE